MVLRLCREINFNIFFKSVAISKPYDKKIQPKSQSSVVHKKIGTVGNLPEKAVLPYEAGTFHAHVEIKSDNYFKNTM